MSKIVLGAPSLSGKDANELVAVAFEGAAFPLKLEVSNLVGHGLSFPEVAGFFLGPVYADSANLVIEVKDYDALQRLASSIEQIAELNHHEAMLTMQAAEEVIVADPVTEELVVDPVVNSGKRNK